MWRAIDLIEEAWRNVVTARSKLRSVAHLSVVAGSLLGATAGHEMAAVRSEVDSLVREGWSIAIFTVDVPSASPSIGIDAHSCAALAHETSGVRASGGLTEGNAIRSVHLPAATPVVLVDRGLLNPLAARPQMSLPIVYLGSALTTTMNAPIVSIADIDHLATPTPAPLDAMGLSNTVLVPSTLTGPVRSCIAVLEPAAVARPLGELAAQLRTYGGQVNAARYRPGLGDHPYDSFLDRISRHLPVVIGALLAIVYGIALRGRGSELGAYLTAGTRRTELAVVALVELVLLAGLQVLAATSALGLAWALLDLRTTPIWTHGLTSAGTFVALGGLFVAGSSRRPLFDLLKDR